MLLVGHSDVCSRSDPPTPRSQVPKAQAGEKVSGVVRAPASNLRGGALRALLKHYATYGVAVSA